MSLRAIAPAVSGFHGLAFLPGGMMAAAPLVVCPQTVKGGGDGRGLLVGRDLVEQFREHGRVTDIAGGELRRVDFQGSLIDPDVDLALDPAFGGPVLTGVQLPFAFHLDAVAIDHQVQGAVRAAAGDVRLQGLLAL